MSDCVVGDTHFSSWALIEPTSSGADHRTEPPLAAFEPLAEYMSSAIEERPKSARQGIPNALMRMLNWKTPMQRQSQSVGVTLRVVGGRNCTNSLQVTVNHSVPMQVIKTSDDAE